MFFIIFMAMTIGITMGISYLVLKHVILENSKSGKERFTGERMTRLKEYIREHERKRTLIVASESGVHLITILFALILFFANHSIGYKVGVVIGYLFLTQYVYKRILISIMFKIENYELNL